LMPELPDVEGFRRHFARYASGRCIARVEVRDPTLVRNTSARGLERALSRKRFAAPRRHGKFLFADAEDTTVVMHFGMTGLLHWTADSEYRHRHDRVIFWLDGGQLSYRNMRKFGGIWLARDDAELTRVTGPLGPDALAVTRDRLRALLAGRRGALKPALMDQRLLAGLGNLLCDEILWQSRLHPRRPVAGLRDRDVERFHDAMQTVLRESNKHARVPGKADWLTGVRDEREARCPRCQTRIRRAQVGGRTTCWCPRCQRERHGSRAPSNG
jgi:formamidopyrimidine-DNA glycosylase